MSRCPKCGNANLCAVSLQKDPSTCWCMKVSVPETTRQSIKSEFKGDACLCLACLHQEIAKGITMNITLRSITEENFETCLNLSVTEEQSHFVAPNIYSIAQSKIYPETTIKAIYHEEEVIGFVMYGRDNESENKDPWLIRLMVDHRYQKKKYGLAAMHLILEEMRYKYPNEAIYLSTSPENIYAIRFYESLGFENTNTIQHDEAVFVLKHD